MWQLLSPVWPEPRAAPQLPQLIKSGVPELAGRMPTFRASSSPAATGQSKRSLPTRLFTYGRFAWRLWSPWRAAQVTVEKCFHLAQAQKACGCRAKLLCCCNLQNILETSAQGAVVFPRLPEAGWIRFSSNQICREVGLCRLSGHQARQSSDSLRPSGLPSARHYIRTWRSSCGLASRTCGKDRLCQGRTHRRTLEINSSSC